MELVNVLVLLATVIVNVVTLHALKKLQSHPLEVELLPVLESTGCDCGCSMADNIKDELSKEIKLLLEGQSPTETSPPIPDESYHAWQNRKEEPTVAPPSPHGPPPVPGPLERPYGFSR